MAVEILRPTERNAREIAQLTYHRYRGLLDGHDARQAADPTDETYTGRILGNLARSMGGPGKEMQAVELEEAMRRREPLPIGSPIYRNAYFGIHHVGVLLGSSGPLESFAKVGPWLYSDGSAFDREGLVGSWDRAQRAMSKVAASAARPLLRDNAAAAVSSRIAIHEWGSLHPYYLEELLEAATNLYDNNRMIASIPDGSPDRAIFKRVGFEKTSPSRTGVERVNGVPIPSALYVREKV